MTASLSFGDSGAGETLPPAAPHPPVVNLLGDVEVRADGADRGAAFTERIQSLLGYLILHRARPQSRQHVAYTFWPDSTGPQALTNLRNLLHRLRQALPGADRLLAVDANTVHWQPEAPVRVDVIAFEQAVAQAQEARQRADRRAEEDALTQAAAVYRGDLLRGSYDDWLVPERERLHQAAVAALERLAGLQEARRAYTGALAVARQLQGLDPLREATYRLLMRLHALGGDRAAVRRTYEQGVTLLNQELGLEPAPETRRLYEQLISTPGGDALPPAGAEPAPSDSAPEAAQPALIGREAEWDALRAIWDRTSAGQAHLVAITGDVGIGKTRLAEELVGWVAAQGGAVARSRSYAAEGCLAFAPVVEWLRSDALRALPDQLDPARQADLARLLPELRPAGHPMPEGSLDPAARRSLFEALARAVLASGDPLVLLLDDAQWCDPDTLEWLRFLLRFAPDAPLLLLLAIRWEEVHPASALHTLILDLSRSAQYTPLPLAPLRAEETARLARALAETPLDDEAVAQLYRETEGHPLFVVDAIQTGGPEAASAPGRTPAVWGSAPQAVFAARLARLTPEARTVAEAAAALGPAFHTDLVAQAVGLPDEAIAAALDTLWQRGMLHEVAPGVYGFTHDKLREAAYAGMSPPRRRLLHRRIAETLEALLTQHPTEVGEAARAQVAAQYEWAGQSGWERTPLPVAADR